MWILLHMNTGSFSYQTGLTLNRQVLTVFTIQPVNSATSSTGSGTCRQIMSLFLILKIEKRFLQTPCGD
ncbi:hypothetical protein K2173_024815 [Erythroxylum novogranatense]|uniref:Uncharacterized protein n=1 Tax=Erythroxylum novogranatense TaxID=1862640 RepID=A0AAV8UC86_9ROSI|nr:hypothetical protein K2173_024815 [Erythroxylum novogranatense]